MDTIIQQFVKSAYKYPKNKAIADINGWYSYERVETITDVMAQVILRRAERKGVIIPERIVYGQKCPRIAVILPRTKDFLVACIGVMKSGCPIVPIEPGYPSDRIAAILSDSECQQIITTSEVMGELRSRQGEDFIAKMGYDDDSISLIEDIIALAPSKVHVSMFDLSQNENEGFILYTSGSTGQPKGVVHRMNLFTYPIYKRHSDVTPSNKWLNIVGFTFIASLLDLYTPLTVGGSVYIANEQERLDIRTLYNIITENGIDYCFMPPKLVNTMLSTFGDMGMKCIITGGEKLMNLPKTNVIVIETYGMSETGAAIFNEARHGSISKEIGELYPEMTAFLIDENGERIEKPGIVGEFCIVSDMLAIGYNNMPELTAKRFVDCPFMPGQIMLKSGDLMEYTPEGKFVFHGRSDHMVKVNGFRVELGEVESVLSKHEHITELACMLKTVNGGDDLCLYYATDNGKHLGENELKMFAEKKLAYYMVPSIYIHLDKLPRNANGKVDRKNLPDPVVEQSHYVAPTTPTEEKLQAIIANVLQIPEHEVSTTSELISLGLNSMLCMQVIIKITDAFRVNLSMKTFYAMGNIQMIGDLIDSGSLKASNVLKVHRVRKSYPAPKGMLGYMKAMSEGYTTLCLIGMYRIEGMTISRMLPALRRVIDAHPSIKLKAGFNKKHEGVIYRDDTLEMPIETIKMDSEPTSEWIDKNIAAKEFGLNEFMVAYTLIETPHNGYFACKCSHAILDGNALYMQFQEFCTMLAGGQIEEEKYTIFDYALDEDEFYKSKRYEEDEKYYKKLVGRKVETMIPFDDEPEVEGWLEAYEYVEMDRYAVDRYCTKNKVQKNSFFATIFMQALAKTAKKKYVMTSSLHSNRSSGELAHMLSLTMRNYPVVTDNLISLDTPTFHQRMASEMRAIQHQIARATDCHFYDYYSIVGLGSKSKNATGKSTFIYYVGLTDGMANPEEQRRLLGCDVEFIDPYPKDFEKKAFNALCLHMESDGPDKYKVTIEYNHTCYHTATIRRFAEIFKDYYTKVINE